MALTVGARCCAGVGIAQASESGRVNTEAAIERVKQLRAACSEWFANVNGGLTKGYDYERAVADQERIAQLFDAVSAEMRKKGPPPPRLTPVCPHAAHRELPLQSPSTAGHVHARPTRELRAQTWSTSSWTRR
jgi:hypothetical protein